MKKIQLIIRKLLFKIVVIASAKSTHRLARKLFTNFMNKNNFRYRISNDQQFMEAGFELSAGHRTQVLYDFKSSEGRIQIQSHFLNIETHQIPQAAILIAHLNTLLRNGKLLINFQNLSAYFEVDLSYASLVLNPEIIDRFHHQVVSMPEDFLWCFDQVLVVNEDPVVVMGELMRRYGI